MYFDTANKQECCGCKACGNICPTHAIDFNKDSEGFWYPEINSNLCSKCNLCRKVCPNNQMKKGEIKDHGQCFAIYSKETDVLKKSTSGGMFTLVSDIILNKKGSIFGCKWNDSIQAIHGRAETRYERDFFCGSKYVQSDINTCYIEIRKLLNSGKYVLFTGTPCQVSALILFLGKDYDKLITIDIVCHGVPSPGVFQDYISLLEKKNNKKIIDYKFREKSIGWSTPQRMITYSDGSINKLLLSHDKFNWLFLGFGICQDSLCQIFERFASSSLRKRTA